MVKYDSILEVWYEEDAVLNPEDGSFTEGHSEWREHCRCRAVSNGQAREAVGANGKVIIYTYQAIVPSYAKRLNDGTKVRIIRKGINIFDGKADGETTYTVQGYDPTGQRNQSRTIWL